MCRVHLVTIHQESEDEETALLAEVWRGGIQCNHEEERSHCTHMHWTRATTEAPIRIGDQMEPYVALIDHDSEINIV